MAIRATLGHRRTVPGRTTGAAQLEAAGFCGSRRRFIPDRHRRDDEQRTHDLAKVATRVMAAHAAPPRGGAAAAMDHVPAQGRWGGGHVHRPFRLPELRPDPGPRCAGGRPLGRRRRRRPLPAVGKRRAGRGVSGRSSHTRTHRHRQGVIPERCQYHGGAVRQRERLRSAGSLTKHDAEPLLGQGGRAGRAPRSRPRCLRSAT